MSELARPIKQHLREVPVQVDAMWERIEARRGSDDLAVWSTWRRRAAFGGALAGAFALAALAVLWLVPRSQPGWLAGRNEGPLARANGDVLGALDTTGTSAALDVALSDGSHLYLDAGARLVPERLDGHQFRASLQTGRVVFDVKPHGPRRWIIDAGETRVEVLGTKFSVERAQGRVAVAVERGRVEVRGPRVPQGGQVLGRGDRLVVDPPPTAAAHPAAAVEANAEANRASTGSESSGGPEANPQAGPDGSGGADTEHSDVAAERLHSKRALAPTVDAADVSADDRLKRSDAARAGGDYRRAAHELQLFLAQHATDPRAALIALTLGRIQLDKLAAPAAAARSFARADRLGLPDAVAEEGAARLVEAYAKSGEKQKARGAAASYARRFPDGARSADVAGWLDLE